MCAAKAEIAVSIPPEFPEGAGSITLSYKGLNLASISIALKKPGQQPQETKPLPAFLIQNLPLLAGIVIVALAAFLVIKRLR